MVTTVVWDDIPHGFVNVVWKGDGQSVFDVPAIINSDTKFSVLQLKLDDNDRRQLIEGNPLYLVVCGSLSPFAISANLKESLDLARGE